MSDIYKFEKYADPSFPVYSSVQKGKHELVTPHFHDDAELFLVNKGTVTALVGAQKHVLSDGDIIYIAPTVAHKVTAETHDASICGLVFHPSVLGAFTDNKTVIFGQRNSVCYKKSSEENKQLVKYFSKAVELYNGVSATYKLEMTAQLLLIVSVLIKSGAVGRECEKVYSDIRPAIDYIEKNYNKKIKISDLGKTLNVCDDHLIRLFKNATSRTPTAYITEYRLGVATKMLSSGEYSVSETAYLTGFSDVYYFSRIFKERLGVTPSHYKKISQAKENGS